VKKVELLSPVGNMEMFYQAVHNGADAVYLAGTSYGARKFAKNFTREELVEVFSYARFYGVKVYVTVNTMIYEEELDDVLEYLGFLHENGVDAVIMQDMGLIAVTRKMYPNLEIHASTQCHNHNKEIVSLWKSLGITRVVFAREMSLEEIKNIDVDIEKEVFVYGALCVCYSGCCLFSSLNGGRSGNRGECVGSCRLPYKLVRNGEVVETKGNYLLSTRELNTMSHVGELIEAGVDSFKIEGRMKSPYYVGYVTRLYRMMIDRYYENKKYELSNEEIINLKKLYNRGFTNGYLFSDKKIMNLESPNHIGVVIGEVVGCEKGRIKIKLTMDNIFQNDGIRFQNKNEGMMVNRLYDKKGLLTSQVSKGEFCFVDDRFGVSVGDMVLKTIDSKLIQELEKFSEKKIPIQMRVECFKGKKLKLEIRDDSHKIVVYGDEVLEAINREVVDEEIKRQLSKLGNTGFVASDILIYKDSNIFVSLKNLNEIRREAVEKLTIQRKEIKKEYQKRNLSLNKLNNLDSKNGKSRVFLHVLVRNEEQLKCCLECGVDDIYVTDYDLYLKYRDNPNVYCRTDRVISKHLEKSHERLLVGDMGSVKKYAKDNMVIGDYYLNVSNHYSVELLRDLGVKRVTLSVELSDERVSLLMGENYPVEMVIYGRLELMVMKYCPLKECLDYCKNCKQSKDCFMLQDKSGARYPMVRNNCFMHILHSEVRDRIDDVVNFEKMGVFHYRLELFDEKDIEIKNLIERFFKKFN